MCEGEGKAISILRGYSSVRWGMGHLQRTEPGLTVQRARACLWAAEEIMVRIWVEDTFLRREGRAGKRGVKGWLEPQRARGSFGGQSLAGSCSNTALGRLLDFLPPRSVHRSELRSHQPKVGPRSRRGTAEPRRQCREDAKETREIPIPRGQRETVCTEWALRPERRGAVESIPERTGQPCGVLQGHWQVRMAKQLWI